MFVHDGTLPMRNSKAPSGVNLRCKYPFRLGLCYNQLTQPIHYSSLEWQHHKKYGVARKHYVDESDFGLARDLVEVLNVFHEITLQVSIASSARLSNVVVFIDQVTDQLSTAISNQKYPPALRNACRIGLKITNKYYSLTDSSPLYRIAICK